MNFTDIALIRLTSQHLVGGKLGTPGELVSYMGAIQAQDYPMARWAVSLRSPGAIDKDVKSAISKAEIIRTHLLRPTWHFVSSKDIYWMLDLSASHIRSAMGSREKQLGLTAEVFSLSNRTLETTLADGNPRTRDELIHALQNAGIATDQNRASHLLARAELEQIISSGPDRDDKITYSLLSQRVPQANRLSREQSLAELALRYFTSRSPATLKDFTWWAGLPARDAAHALELVKSNFISEIIANRQYWINPAINNPKSLSNTGYLLPTYDEFLLSYTDRNASIGSQLEQHMKQISDRGIFRPIVVVNGQVVGVWKRTIKKDVVCVEIHPFSPLGRDEENLINQAADQFAQFLGKILIFSVTIM
jgi:hypothetical protein